MENKKRLIDANALRNKIAEENPYIHIGPFGYCACSPKTDGVLVFKREDVLRAIDSAPTVDAVVLPCKVGDTLYVITQMRDKRILPFINQYEATNIKVGKRKCVVYHEQDGFMKVFKQDDFGKTVFLTREEAEAALAKMDGDGNG